MKKTNAIRILDKYKVSYDTLAYQYDTENLDVAKIAEDNQLQLAAVYKSLVLKGDKNGVFVAVVPGDKVLDLKSAAKISGNKKVHLLPIKDLEKTTGYIRGGCSPIGMKKNFPVYVDSASSELDKMYINAGKRGIFVAIHPSSLEEVCNAEFGDICSEKT